MPSAVKRSTGGRAARAPRPRTDIYERLRDEILNGGLAPNERLVEEELVERFRTSRGYVRVALARLEQDGLVVRRPNRGAHVRMVSAAEAIEISEVRCALEVIAARRAAERRQPEHLSALKAILQSMDERLRAGDLPGYSQLNGAFHRTIREAGAQLTANKVLNTLQSQAIRFQLRSVLIPGRPERSLAEHKKIYKAIADGDADRAAAAMLLHLSHVDVAMRDVLHRALLI